jgi:hypothetical protein
MYGSDKKVPTTGNWRKKFRITGKKSLCSPTASGPSNRITAKMKKELENTVPEKTHKPNTFDQYPHNRVFEKYEQPIPPVKQQT